MSKTNIHQLLQTFAQTEMQLSRTQFLAPCVGGGRIRTRIQGMVYTFTPEQRDFGGWGIFQPVDTKIATLVEPAAIWQVDEYLRPLSAIRLRLAYPLRQQTWLAYPCNEADMRQRFGTVRPIIVHLVTEGTTFEGIVARALGFTFYFEMVDRKADPELATHLHDHLHQRTPIPELRFSGLTPEMRTVYELVARQTPGFPLSETTSTGSSPRTLSQDEQRLRDALTTGGGSLDRVEDKGDFWTVAWRTGDGEEHTSAISKRDLTVITAGICLDGLDQDFDLQSLVGVVEQRWD